MTTPTTIEERVSRLEGGNEHMATKADVESVKVEVERVKVEVERVKVEVERVRSEIRDAKISTILWVAGMMLVTTSIQIGAVFTIVELLTG